MVSKLIYITSTDLNNTVITSHKNCIIQCEDIHRIVSRSTKKTAVRLIRGCCDCQIFGKCLQCTSYIISYINTVVTIGGQKKVGPHYNTGIGIYNVNVYMANHII